MSAGWTRVATPPALAAAYISGLALLAQHPLGMKSVAPLANVGRMALSHYLLQIPFSAAWLMRFRFGPLEWAWRSMTYRQR